MRILIIIGFFLNGTVASKNHCAAIFRENITDGQKLGNTISKNGVRFTEDNYFSEGNTTWGCVCSLKQCVRKCCGIDEIMLNETCTSSPLQEKFKDFINFSDDTTYFVYANDSYCSNKVIVHKDDFFVDKNGFISVKSLQKSFSPEVYCLETFFGDTHNYAIVVICLEESTTENISRYCPEVSNSFGGITAIESGDNNENFSSNARIWDCRCRMKPCVRKCCGENEIVYNRSCVQYLGYGQQSFSNLLRNYSFREETHQIFFSNGEYCPPDYYPTKVEHFKILENGYISTDEFILAPAQYCVDIFSISNTEYQMGTVLCVKGDDDTFSYVHLTGMIISMPFLLITFLVYAIIPESNLHRKALMNYVLTLLLAYIFLVVVQLYPGKIDENFVCPALGYLIIFFFLISFFWMNVMCLDMWFAFSGMRGFNGRRLAEKKRFLMYFAYAVGVPSLHILVVFLLNRFGDQESNYFPGIGTEKCFLRDGYPNLFYFYGPMAILITVNVTLFILTAVKIQKVKRETSMLKQSESRRHAYEDDKQKFNLYVKLLFAMGINWTMEVISWAIEWRTKNVPSYVWYLTDFCNAVYGVFIFFIFVFKKKIWRSLKKRYYVFIGKPHFAHSVSVTQTTRSSNYSTTETGLNDHRLSELKNGRGEERMLPHN